MLRAVALGSLAVLLLLSTGCSSGDTPPPTASIPGEGADQPGSTDPSVPDSIPPVQLNARDPISESPAQTPVNLYPEVVVKTSLGNIRVQLNAEAAPQTVDNFLENYVDRGFYSDTVVHYVDPQFMVAAGGYDGQYKAKETRTPIANEADNGLTNAKGTIAMARLPEYVDSATSQFFINVQDNPGLDYQKKEEEMNGYCVFGKVVEGMDIVDKIAKVPTTDRENLPNSPAESVTIIAIERVR